MTLDERLVQEALRQGAAKAAVITREQVVLSAAFRDSCEANTCGKYGNCYMCPPDVGDIDALMAQVWAYPRALVYQTITPLEDSFDYEGMVAAASAHVQLSQRLQGKLSQMLSPGYLHLTSGGCGLCDECLKRENKPCRYPDQALPSVESYGVDVYHTVKDTELKYINGANTVTYFAMVLFAPEGQ